MNLQNYALTKPLFREKYERLYEILPFTLRKPNFNVSAFL